MERILQTGGARLEPGTAVLYARVSTKKQAHMGNLDRQLERLRACVGEKGYRVVAEHSDVAPGLNRKRRGLEWLSGASLPIPAREGPCLQAWG